MKTIDAELVAELVRVGAFGPEMIEVRTDGPVAIFEDTQEASIVDATQALAALRQLEAGAGFEATWMALGALPEPSCVAARAQGRSGTVSVSVSGTEWKAEVEADGRVTISRWVGLGGPWAWAGAGRWAGSEIVDCDADLPEGVYSALEHRLAAMDQGAAT